MAQKLLCSSPIHLPPQPLTTTNLPPVPIVLPLLECHAVEIIQYGAFSDSLLSFNNMHLFPIPIHALIAHFFFVAVVWLLSHV